MKVTQSFPTLCDPMDYTVHGILQARILEWVAFPFSQHSFPFLIYISLPFQKPTVRYYRNSQRREIQSQFSSVAQSCPTLCDPMNCSTPGLPVYHQLPKFTQTHVHPAVSSSVVPFSSCPQSLPESESFPMRQIFT